MIRLVALGTALAGLLSLGYNAWDQQQPYLVTGYFASADQVVAGNQVMLNGVPVGTVQQVSVAPDSSEAGALLKLQIDRRYAPLHEGTKALIRPKGLLGEMFVELQPGSGRPMPRGAGIPLHDTVSPVTLDEVNDIFDPQTRQYVHTLTLQGGATFAGRGADVNTLLTQLPAIAQDAADISAQLASRDQELDALAREFDRVAAMLAAEAEALKRDLANGARLLDVLAQHQATLQQELVEADAALAKVNQALGGHEKDLNSVLKQLPPLLDSLRTFQDNSAAALGVLAPCTNDILGTLGEIQSATSYRTPQGSTDGQGFELRTYANNARTGPSAGSFNPSVPCTGGTP